MKALTVCGAAALALTITLSGCATPEAGPAPGWGQPAARRAGPPVAIGNGLGSEFGNYPARPDGVATGANGETCTLFDWDRPLGHDLALRLRSASCEAPGRPGTMVSTELSRAVIPLAASPLRTDSTVTPPL
ncbi:hypothetical protein [Phaeospirillum tilakii]|uniref:Uncharacterized protein n=1 Tax=Phaeospirillum tilakii TaxID=741673 RepID=A0ABW5C841_9PROT